MPLDYHAPTGVSIFLSGKPIESAIIAVRIAHEPAFFQRPSQGRNPLGGTPPSNPLFEAPDTPSGAQDDNAQGKNPYRPKQNFAGNSPQCVYYTASFYVTFRRLR